jgi:hypothetical protein
MRLSAEIYEQIIGGLKSDGVIGKDKRREPRVGLAGEADYVTISGDGTRQAGVAKIRDVSRTGIGLVCAQQVPKHQRFVVQLESSNEQPIWLVCNVAYCRRTDMGRFSVGAKIMQVLRAADIQKVEAKAAAAVAAATNSPAKPNARAPRDEQADIARIAKAILDG